MTEICARICFLEIFSDHSLVHCINHMFINIHNQRREYIQWITLVAFLSHMYMIVKSDEEIRSVQLAYLISERKK